MAEFKDHFSERALGYARARPTYPEALAEHLAALAPSRALAWDAGCGSGQLSVALAERFERVVATDASAAQIASAEPRPNLEYRAAPAEVSGLPASSADLATAAQAAHWFDLDAYYREVRRVGRPGAIVALISYGIMVVDPEIDPVLMRFYSGVLGPHWPPERTHVEDGYRSLPFPFERIPAPELEIRLAWDLEATLAYVRTWSALNAYEKLHGPEATEAFDRELAGVWGDEVRLVRWPLALKLGRL